MNIGELADRSGVPAKTIRYYEKSKLIPPAKRDVNGYRIYGPADVERLEFLRRARAFDFSIEECRALLQMLGDPHRKSGDVKRLTEGHIASLDQKLKELRALRKQLGELSQACSGDESADCAILDALVSGT